MTRFYLSDADLKDAEEIAEELKKLDPAAQRLILERISGMKDMQDIMEEQKTA